MQQGQKQKEGGGGTFQYVNYILIRQLEKFPSRSTAVKGTILAIIWPTNNCPFPDSSDAKESACNAGNPSSIPGLGRSAGEGIGHPLQYSWASLVAQLVKNPPATLETWVQSLGWEDPLERGKATHSSILAWRIPWTVQSMRSQRVRQDWVTFSLYRRKYYITITYIWETL